MLRFILLSVGFGIAFFLSDYFKMNQYLPEQKWSILLFFTVLSLYFSRMLARGFDNKREYLVQFSLIYKVSKLLLSIVFVGLVLYKGVAYYDGRITIQNTFYRMNQNANRSVLHVNLIEQAFIVDNLICRRSIRFVRDSAQ